MRNTVIRVLRYVEITKKTCILLVYHLDFVMFRVEINKREIAHPQEILQSPGRIVLSMQGITKRCRLFGLTNSALVYER